MAEQQKDDKGRFTNKSTCERKIRSIRATDETWNLLGDRAEENDMTRADFLESLVTGQVEWEESKKEKESTLGLDFDVDEVSEILKEALTLKSNAGGKIKTKIRQVLELMNIELDDNN